MCGFSRRISQSGKSRHLFRVSGWLRYTYLKRQENSGLNANSFEYTGGGVMSNLKKMLLGGVILVIVAILVLANQYVDLIWFQTMGASSVFWVPLVTGPLTKLIVGLLIAAFFMFNLWLALKTNPPMHTINDRFPGLSKEVLWFPGLLSAAVLAFFLTAGSNLDWTVVQQFLHPVSTGTLDPIFRRDIGFYLFTFPFLQNLYHTVLATTFLGLIGIAAVYVATKVIWRYNSFWEIKQPAKIHLLVLTTLFLATKIWGYQLNRYNLLFHESERLTGINYTAAHANLMVYQILTWVVVVVIAVLWLNLKRDNLKLLLGSIGVWVILSFALSGLYPNIFQYLVVKPNEKELEIPYLQKHIEFTRQAYQLDRIKNHNYHPQNNRAAKLQKDNPVLADLRLWDYRPLQSSYNQLQSIRPYYRFGDIDIDRYPTASAGQRQIMLSARELIAAELPTQAQASWINLHLTYTHGYGYAANQVSDFSGQGQPVFISKNLPPQTAPGFPALQVKHPEIYYGEQTNHYIIVKTRTPEFDYPKGDNNTSTVYRANNGIKISSPGMKLLMALKYKEANFFLSSQMTAASRVLMYRNIRERSQKLAPFLAFDRDPYLVVAKGKLYWIIDAYTTSAFYPYSRYHSRKMNYIRNSVKAVIDAYDGTVRFYITDLRDPVIRVWQRVFPRIFAPLASLDPEIRSHFRYPEDLMTIQSELLAQYHMTNPKTFFAQEDNWDIPVHNEREKFTPYYVTLKLPGADRSEFVTMQPFVPRNKQNLSSWLIARCDAPRYGELTLYTLPKDQNIYGPAQIDSRINQDQTISQLITLWNQNQSRVLWGDLLIIPIEDSILYLKPLFIESEQTKQAELKKVVMVYQNQVALGNTVSEALDRLDNNLPELTVLPEPAVKVKQNLPQPIPAPNRRTEIIQRLKQLSKELQQLSEELQSLK
jgi:uncharacterized membrane protein (UPF0182 family)